MYQNMKKLKITCPLVTCPCPAEREKEIPKWRYYPLTRAPAGFMLQQAKAR